MKVKASTGLNTQITAILTILLDIAVGAGWIELDAEQVIALNGAFGALIAFFLRAGMKRHARETTGRIR